jgi:hypothetical protein
MLKQLLDSFSINLELFLSVLGIFGIITFFLDKLINTSKAQFLSIFWLILVFVASILISVKPIIVASGLSIISLIPLLISTLIWIYRRSIALDFEKNQLFNKLSELELKALEAESSVDKQSTINQLTSELTLTRKEKDSYKETSEQYSKQIKVLENDNKHLKAQISQLQEEVYSLDSILSQYNMIQESYLITEQVALLIESHLHSPDDPPVEHALSFILDRMMSTVLHTSRPEQFRVCIAKPLMDGKFKVLAARNILFERVISIQKYANWIEGTSLFSIGVKLGRDYIKCPSSSDYHYDFEKPHENYLPSRIHLIIPVLEQVNDVKGISEKCLAVLTIGTIDEKLLKDERRVVEYLAPQLNGIRMILGHYQK